MKVLFLMLLMTLSFNGFTKEGGNGGGVHMCGNRVELYDFYEGRSEQGHKLSVWQYNRSKNFDAYIAMALDHVKKDIPQVHELVANMVSTILSIPRDELFKNISIPVIDDATITILGRGCRYQQVANWNERFQKLFINRSLFEKLDPMNQAGLILHEAVYKLSRNTKVANETSDSVREVVARIFSNDTLTSTDAEVVFSSFALINATKPQCDYARESIAKVEALMNGEDTLQVQNLLKSVVDICLEYCKIPEDREFCETKL